MLGVNTETKHFETLLLSTSSRTSTCSFALVSSLSPTTQCRMDQSRTNLRPDRFAVLPLVFSPSGERPPSSAGGSPLPFSAAVQAATSHARGSAGSAPAARASPASAAGPGAGIPAIADQSPSVSNQDRLHTRSERYVIRG